MKHGLERMDTEILDGIKQNDRNMYYGTDARTPSTD